MHSSSNMRLVEAIYALTVNLTVLEVGQFSEVSL